MSKHPIKNHMLMLVTKEIHTLEYDPQAQYTFNLYCLWFFLIQMPIVLVLLAIFNKFWIAISIVYVAEISIWALVATHFGAMSAALAAKLQDDENKRRNSK